MLGMRCFDHSCGAALRTTEQVLVPEQDLAACANGNDG